MKMDKIMSIGLKQLTNKLREQVIDHLTDTNRQNDGQKNAEND